MPQSRPSLFTLSVMTLAIPLLISSPAAAQKASPAGSYANALAVWKGGNQRKAEQLLDGYAEKFPGSEKIALFQATCVRSRFQVESAAPLFVAIVARAKSKQDDLSKSSPQALCALAMLAIDSRKNVDAGFRVLNGVVAKNPSDPIPIWLLAIACRTYNRDAEGVAAYRKLLAIAAPGSSLVHQTFANMLDKLGKHDEALKSRYMAVKLEPSPWSYDGLAGTLGDMGRYDESVAMHKKVTEIAPDVPNYWNNLGAALHMAGKYDEAIVAYKQAIELRPHYAKAWRNWGKSLEKQSKQSEADEKYARAKEYEASE